jgi:ABC-type antimicrobial peptide transport system permease subunit
MGEAMAGVKTAVGEVSPAIGIEFRILAGQLNESLMRERLMATLSGTFGGLAALLATLGLYGVISYMVARRRNEIGVRMALGADRMKVVRLVLREAVLLLAVGLTVGVLLALWAGRAATTLLFGLQPYDPITMLSAVALLTVVALAASYGPARRAAALDPMTALRDE